MSEYIERDAILKKLDEREEFLRSWLSKFRSGSPDYNYFAYRLNEFIENSWTVRHAPTADVAPVVHGMWIYDGGNEYVDHYHCDQCQEEIDLCNEIYTEPKPNYCQNCGARMDKEADDAR